MKTAGLWLFAWGAIAALAAEPAPESPVTAAPVFEIDTLDPGLPFYAGVRFRSPPGWHVSWKNPGDAGLPPKLTWKLPAGFSAGPLLWPAPERFDAAEVVTYGYSGEVFLLCRIVPPPVLPADETVRFVLQADWLACGEDACVPGTARWTVERPVATGAAALSDDWQTIERVVNTIPRPAPDWGVTAVEEDGRAILTVHPPEAAAAPVVRAARFFPLTPGYAVEARTAVGGYALRRAPEAPDDGVLEGVLAFPEEPAPGLPLAIVVRARIVPAEMAVENNPKGE